MSDIDVIKAAILQDFIVTLSFSPIWLIKSWIFHMCLNPKIDKSTEKKKKKAEISKYTSNNKAEIC